MVVYHVETASFFVEVPLYVAQVFSVGFATLDRDWETDFEHRLFADELA